MRSSSSPILLETPLAPSLYFYIVLNEFYDSPLLTVVADFSDLVSSSSGIE